MPDHLAPEVPRQHDQAARHDPVVEDLLVVVDVVDEEVERLDALPQPRLDQPPLAGRDQARDQVERKDPLSPLRRVGVDGEGDPLVQEGAVGEIAGAAQCARVAVPPAARRAPGSAGEAQRRRPTCGANISS